MTSANTGAMLYQLRYEAALSFTTAVQIWIIIFIFTWHPIQSFLPSSKIYLLWMTRKHFFLSPVVSNQQDPFCTIAWKTLFTSLHRAPANKETVITNSSSVLLLQKLQIINYITVAKLKVVSMIMYVSLRCI